MEVCKKEELHAICEIFETIDTETAEILVKSGRWVLMADYMKHEEADGNRPPYRDFVLGRVWGQKLYPVSFYDPQESCPSA